MKSKIKQKEEELEKGCGKVFQRQGVSKCGQIIMKTLILCEKCQAKLQGFQEAKKLFIDNELKFLKDIQEQENLLCKVCKTRNDKVFQRIEEIEKVRLEK